MWLSKLTTLDMIPLGWLGRKTSTQPTNQASGYQALGIRQPGTGHLIAESRHRSSVTSQQSISHRSVCSNYQAPGTITWHHSPGNQSPGTSQFTRHRSSGVSRSALNTWWPIRHTGVLSIHYWMSLRTKLLQREYYYHWSQILVKSRIQVL